MKAKEFDRKFDEGKNIKKYLNLTKARRPEQEQKRINCSIAITGLLLR